MESQEFESKWENLLLMLDDRLQLGLLNKLEALNGHYLEGDTIILETNNQLDFEYLSKPQVKQQIELFLKETFESISEVQIVNL